MVLLKVDFIQNIIYTLNMNRNIKIKRFCKIEGCNTIHKGHGYCQKHLNRWKKHGDPMFTENHRHGMSHTTIYEVWAGMKKRCINPNNKDYDKYGGRGITICDRWLNSFENFYEDMGDRPFKGAQLDRKENDKGYYKSNCRWVTSKQNNNNRRNPKGRKLNPDKVREIRSLYPEFTQDQLAKRYGVWQTTIEKIINYKIWKNI